MRRKNVFSFINCRLHLLSSRIVSYRLFDAQTAVSEFEASSTGAHVSVEKRAAMARVAIAAKKLRFAAAVALAAAKSE